MREREGRDGMGRNNKESQHWDRRSSELGMGGEEGDTGTTGATGRIQGEGYSDQSNCIFQVSVKYKIIKPVIIQLE